MLVALTSSSICAIVRSVRPLRVIFHQVRSERMNFQCCWNKRQSGADNSCQLLTWKGMVSLRKQFVDKNQSTFRFQNCPK